MRWFKLIMPEQFFKRAAPGIALIVIVFAVLLAAVAVLTVKALKRESRRVGAPSERGKEVQSENASE